MQSDNLASVAEPAGKAQELKREFTLWSAFTFAFAFISPIVCLYAIFAITFAAGGPASWWGFLFVFAGQVLVALVLAELASRYPLEGSVYQWSRVLGGATYGWFTGWAYMWTLALAMAAVGYAAGFVPTILGIEPFSQGTQLLVAMGLVAFATFANIVGRTFMKVLLAGSIMAEIIGSLVIGTVLLLFFRENPISVVFETFGTGQGSGGYLWSGLFAAMAFIGWGFVGFESAGAIAEEVREPRRDVPKAIVFSLVFVSLVVIYSALALILAIPDIPAVLAGDVVDPVAETMTTQLGSALTSPLFALFLIGFLASLLALQASCSRVMWAFARDGVLPASGWLKKLSSEERIPRNTVIVAGCVAALLLLATNSERIYFTLLSFTTGGFYLVFLLPVLGALISRLRGRWEQGPFTLGGLGPIVTLAATVWLVFELLNISWPRAGDLPWYQNWGVAVMIAVVGVLGVLTYLPLRERISRVHDTAGERDAAPASTAGDKTDEASR
ncbi:MAG TPA: amino acid permease [Rubrobacter sp.]|nr:amino acid permease [Rubrobacter sp.]